MGTLAICPWTRAGASVRATDKVRTRTGPRPATAPVRQERDDSPLAHAGAADALVLAASSIHEEAGPGVVAVVLDDGTVLTGANRAPAARWANGTVSGRDWTLWWERRALEEA